MPHEPQPRGVVFDLDGVLVTTDRYHYRAWKELADELGIPFDEERNHLLRGVSREESLRRIYADRPLPPPDVFRAQCDRKNARYVELVRQMTPDHVLPGSLELLAALRTARIRRAVASASRNCAIVLERTGLKRHFDAVVDGGDVTASKPDPQGFLLACRRLEAAPADCLGVEDAESGVEAIHRAGMLAVGIGSQARGAELAVGSVRDLTLAAIRLLWRERRG